MVITDFKLRYQGSVLGYFWSLLKPLALFGILYVVFINFFKFKMSPVYLLLGIVLWTYFVEVTNQGVRAILDRDELIRKISFPRYVIVLSVAVSSLINLILNLAVVGLFMALQHVDVHWSILWVPLLIVELFVLALAVAAFLSALYVKFRDLIYIWEVFLQGAFYATPIIYPMSLVPPEAAKWLLLNPMAQIIQDMRWAMVAHDTVTPTSVWGTTWIQLIPIGLVVIITLSAVIYFRAQSHTFAEDV